MWDSGVALIFGVLGVGSGRRRRQRPWTAERDDRGGAFLVRASALQVKIERVEDSNQPGTDQVSGVARRAQRAGKRETSLR